MEQAFQAALKQVSEGHPDNAITDAATALQEYLTSIGCSGNTLQPLMESARNKGLLGAHDAPLTAGVLKLTDWVNADRVGLIVIGSRPALIVCDHCVPSCRRPCR